MSFKLAIIDWGIGGISVYQHFRGRGGIVYVSDTGATPYGKMSRPELAARLHAVIDFLKTKDVTHLIIACNAASTAIRDLKREDVVIEGVIDAAIESTTKLKPTKLGVIGGRRTVLSGIYRRAFANRGIATAQRVAQPLSGLIESGDTSSDKLRAECRRILAPLSGCSHLLLACTHYPAIAGVVADFLKPDAVLIDPAAAVAERVAEWRFPDGDTDEFFTTGDPLAMQTSARNAFGVEIANPLKITI